MCLEYFAIQILIHKVRATNMGDKHRIFRGIAWLHIFTRM